MGNKLKFGEESRVMTLRVPASEHDNIKAKTIVLVARVVKKKLKIKKKN